MGSYQDGVNDVLPVKGTQLTSTIDARLQEFAEKLMVGKVGAVVALEPATGEILVMVSSPTYNPDMINGGGFSDRAENITFKTAPHFSTTPDCGISRYVWLRIGNYL